MKSIKKFRAKHFGVPTVINKSAKQLYDIIKRFKHLVNKITLQQTQYLQMITTTNREI